MSRCAKSCAAALCWALAGSGLSAGENGDQAASPSPGRTLFVQAWSVQDRRSPNGDGLGPMHNATSCGACHHQAGAGGGGDVRHNVELLSIVPVKVRDERKAQFISDVVAVHAGFEIKVPSRDLRPNLVLHRFCTEPEYQGFRERLLRMGQPPTAPVKVLEPVAGIVFNLSERNTPALWGAGLIDSIPEGTIQAVAKAQKKDRPETAGRAAIADTGGVGRFGWRGQTGLLRGFVVNACANELGLQTASSPQAMYPLSADYRLEGQDMSVSDVNELVNFVSSLPRPVEAKLPTSLAAENARLGEQVFDRIGCSDCHPRTLGQVNGLFSDLLLHDMGSGLEDPVEPNSTNPSSGAYYGGGSVFVAQRGRSPVNRDSTLPCQWRTPPLWGVCDSAPYLHDGRAATLAEAILQHGGQGAAATRQFRNLPATDRERLMTFLSTLKAPPQRDLNQVQRVSF